MYLLDTNHASRVIERDPVVTLRLDALSEADFAINVVIEGELLFMARNSSRAEENLGRVWGLLRLAHIYPVDSSTAAVYGELKSELFDHFGPKERAARRRTTLGQLGFDDNDLWIAATALQHNLTIVSADSDFPRIAEVRPLPIESWWIPPQSS